MYVSTSSGLTGYLTHGLCQTCITKDERKMWVTHQAWGHEEGNCLTFVKFCFFFFLSHDIFISKCFASNKFNKLYIIINALLTYLQIRIYLVE